MGRVFTEKQLNYARTTNVFDFMLAQGESFDDSGTYWFHSEHDSLYVKKKTRIATWSSRNISSYKNAIEFISAFYEMPYENAVQTLLDFRSEYHKDKQYTRSFYPLESTSYIPPFDRNVISEKMGTFDTKVLDISGKNYLRSRFIDDQIIAEFEKKKLITSDNQKNLLFNISDLGMGVTGQPVGAVVQGTYPKPLEKRIRQDKDGHMKLDRKYFKGMAKNSHSSRGFLFGFVESFNAPITLFVVEAPLEGISLYELKKEQLSGNNWFLSLNGLKEQTLWETAEILNTMFKENGVTIVMALNNDEKGLEATKRMHMTYKNREDLKSNYKMELYLPNLKNGDWNEMLEIQKTGKLNSRLEKQQDKAEAEKIVEKKKMEQQEYEVIH